MDLLHERVEVPDQGRCAPRWSILAELAISVPLFEATAGDRRLNMVLLAVRRPRSAVF